MPPNEETHHFERETHHFERETHCSKFLDQKPFNIKLDVTYKFRIWKYWSVSWKGKQYTTIYNICVIRGPIFLQKGEHQRMHVRKLQLEKRTHKNNITMWPCIL